MVSVAATLRHITLNRTQLNWSKKGTYKLRSLFTLSLLQTTLNETLEALPANGIAELSSLLDPAWIEQALQATGKASVRRRKLPAEGRDMNDLHRAGALRAWLAELLEEMTWATT